MLDALTKFSTSSRIYLILAYILYEKLENKFKALYFLMKAEENLPSI